MLKEREQSKLRLSGSQPLPRLKATIRRSSVMQRNFEEKGCLLKVCKRNPDRCDSCDRPVKCSCLMNELIVTYNIKKMSAWYYMTRSEDDWLSATQSNQLLQPTSEVNSLPSPWSRSALQWYTWGNGVICDQREYCLNNAMNKDVSVTPGNTTPGLESTKLMGRHQKWMSGMALHLLQIPHCMCAWYSHQPQPLNIILSSQTETLALQLYHFFFFFIRFQTSPLRYGPQIPLNYWR